MADMDDYRLEDVVGHHDVNVGIFLPFAAVRLTGGAKEAIWTVKLRDLEGPGESQRQLRLRWSTDPGLLTAVPDRTITEWAALGVAAAVVARYSSWRISNVSALGDGFDYWLTDGAQDIALEVSGTQTPDLESRHRAKVRQWQANPHGVDGCIVVVGFGTAEAIFSYHRFAEVAP